MGDEEEEVFGFSGNVFVESIDVKERKRLNEERKAAARKVSCHPTPDGHRRVLTDRLN
jgi:hypothetical protein